MSTGELSAAWVSLADAAFNAAKSMRSLAAAAIRKRPKSHLLATHRRRRHR